MKTIKNISVLLLLLGCSFYANAQCGVHTYFNTTVTHDTVEFHDYTTVDTSWYLVGQRWFFGDGTTDTGTANPVHIYPNSGTYNVCEIVTGYHGGGVFCTDTFCRSVAVTNSTCNLNAGFQFAVHGDSVTFYPATNPFGTHSDLVYYYNNTASYDTVPFIHIFPSSPNDVTYRVCRFVYNNNCVDSFCQNILIQGTSTNPCGNTQANFTITQNGSSVTLHNSSIGTPSGALFQWWWIDSFSYTNPIHDTTYTFNNVAGGSNTFCLYVYANANTFCDSICRTENIGNSPCAGLTADFVFHVLSNDSVRLETRDTNTTANHYWNFGDGSSGSGMTVNHHYSSAGTYHVCSYVYIPGVSCVDSFCQNIVVGNNACGGLTAQWTQTYNPNGGVHFLPSTTIPNVTSRWDFGDSAYSTLFDPTHCYATGGLYTVRHIVSIPGTVCADTSILSIQANACNTTPQNDTLCGTVFNDTNNNGVLDSNETAIVNADVYIDSSVVLTDSFGHYLIVLPNHPHYIHTTAPNGCLLTLPFPNPNSNPNGYYYTPAFNYGGTHCGYDFGINCNIVHICGTVFFDANNNHLQDSTEAGLPNVSVTITGNGAVHHAYTDQFGNYCETLPAGTYTVTIASPNAYPNATVTPQSLTVNATSNGATYSGNNFAVYVQPGACDLSIEITPHTTVTAGYPAWYDIQVCNVGGSSSDGEVNLFYDPAVIYDHASPAATSQNSSTHTVTWDFTNLLPGYCLYYWVAFNADSQLTLNQFVFTLASVTPGAGCNDINFANNVDTVHQAVTASWDPNNKLAYKTNYEANPAYQWVSSVDANQKIQYVINFQNTGTAPAVNVVVKDAVTPDLDLNSFQLLGTSHAGVITSNGSELNFKFSNIMLPPASQDEPNSHGWIKFSANAVNGLAGGHVIADPADIYFDYNAPVATNNAAVILLDASGIDEIANAVTVVIAPNPMSDYTMITLSNSQAENFRFRINDLTGRLIDEKLSDGNTLQFNRNSLAAGLYTYQIIQNNKVVAKGKLVMQ